MHFQTETERLWLREFEEADVAAYYALGSDPDVVRFTGAAPLTSWEQALETLRANPLADYQRHGFGRWACVLKSTGSVIGFAGLKHLDELSEIDFGVWLLPEYWNLGLATEAGRAVLAHAFDCLHLERVIGLVNPANGASIRVLEKLGMTGPEFIEYRGEQTLKYQLAKKAIHIL